MKKLRKLNKPLFLLLLGLTICPLFSVSALSDRHSSYVDMAGGQTVIGSARSYKYKNHKIEMIPTKLVPSQSDSQGQFVQVDIGLDKKKGTIFTSWSNNVASGTLVFRETNKTYTLYMGNQGSGTFRYTFYTGNAATWYGGFRADPVYMYSYE